MRGGVIKRRFFSLFFLLLLRNISVAHVVTVSNLNTAGSLISAVSKGSILRVIKRLARPFPSGVMMHFLSRDWLLWKNGGKRQKKKEKKRTKICNFSIWNPEQTIWQQTWPSWSWMVVMCHVSEKSKLNYTLWFFSTICPDKREHLDLLFGTSSGTNYAPILLAAHSALLSRTHHYFTTL